GLDIEETGIGFDLRELVAEPVSLSLGGFQLRCEPAPDSLPVLDLQLAPAVIALDPLDCLSGLGSVPLGGGEKCANLSKLVIAGLAQLLARRLDIQADFREVGEDGAIDL